MCSFSLPSSSSWNYSFKTNAYVNGVNCATTSGEHEYVIVFRVGKLLFMEVWPIWVITALLEINGGEEDPKQHLLNLSVQCGTKHKFPSFCCKDLYV